MEKLFESVYEENSVEKKSFSIGPYINIVVGKGNDSVLCDIIFDYTITESIKISIHKSRYEVEDLVCGGIDNLMQRLAYQYRYSMEEIDYIRSKIDYDGLSEVVTFIEGEFKKV